MDGLVLTADKETGLSLDLIETAFYSYDDKENIMRVHVVPFDDKNIIYVPDSISYFSANNITTELALLIAEGGDYNMAKEKFPHLKKQVYDEINNRLKKDDSIAFQSQPEDVLERLIINISNDCNMRCKYCYANQGVYGHEKNIMSLETMLRVLDSFYAAFNQIGLIQLFGGEPAMNMDAVEFACKYVKNKGYKTRMGIVTNGTIVTERLISIIKKYDLNVTVSVDVESVHDRLRPFPKNKPSWENVKNNIHKMQRETRQPTQIELTYTKVHVDEKITICDTLKELEQEYGNIPVHVTPVSTEDERFQLETRDAFIDSISEIYKKRSNGETVNYTWLNKFELSLKYHAKMDYLCGAGISTLSASTQGDIYPCFYFTDKEDYIIANVSDDIEDIKKKILKKRDNYFSNKKVVLDKCKDCFANTICTGCLGANLDENNDMFKVGEKHCNMTKNMIESILIQIALSAECKG